MPSSTENTEKQEKFMTYVGNRNFHHIFHLNRDGSLPIRVTYADYGCQDEGNEAVILVCGPMMATRYLYIAKDALAKENRVRIIHPDRFGFGGSTEINADERVKIWLEVVPALLHHLKIKQVSLMAHSAGTIYALNILLYQRHLLHPTRPYVAIGAPWIRPIHTGATSMQLMKIVPNALMRNFHVIAPWFINNVVPVASFSGNVAGTVGTSIGSLFHKKVVDDEAAFVFEDELQPIIIDMAYAENVQGLSQEILLLFKRGNDNDWGAWIDYDRYVPMLASAEEAARETAGLEAQKLHVDVFYAETDVLIGTTKGPKYLNDCWSETQRGPNIEYCSRIVKGADHDRIWNLRWGAVQHVFAEVRSRCGE